MDPIEAGIIKLNERIEFESLKSEIDERLISFLKAERQLLFDRQDKALAALAERKMHIAGIQFAAQAAGLLTFK
jgi:type II restriction/modification system DNA methylase subunit YeeA